MNVLGLKINLKVAGIIMGAVALILLVSGVAFGPVGFLIAVVLFVGVPILYVGTSFKIIKAEEKGATIRLGTPNEFRKSGPTFVWQLIERIKLFTAKPQQVELGTVHAFSKQSERHESAKVTADVSLRFLWPNGKQLVGIVKYISDPYDLAEAVKLLKRDCIELIKEILSRLDWERAYANRERIIDISIESQLKELDKNHILKLLKLKNLEFQITNVEVPEELLRAPAEKEIEAHKKAAREIAAEAAKIEITLRGEGRAKSLGLQREAMGAPREAVYVKAESRDDDETVSVIGLPSKDLFGEIAKQVKSFFGGKDK